MLVLPLFKATGNILLQIAPGNVPPSAFAKCSRQVNSAQLDICLVQYRKKKMQLDCQTHEEVYIYFSRLLLVKMFPKYGKVDFGSLYLVRLLDLCPSG